MTLFTSVGAILYSFARLLFRQLPASIRYRLRRDRYSEFEKSPQFSRIRQNVCRIPVNDHSFVDVFWKTLPNSWGPAASVIVYDQEIMRFDCLGAGKGHYHASLFQNSLASELRLFFPEKTLDQQIDRSVFELTTNLYYYTQRSPYPEARTFQLETELLQKVGEQMRQKMNECVLSSPLPTEMSQINHRWNDD